MGRRGEPTVRRRMPDKSRKPRMPHPDRRVLIIDQRTERGHGPDRLLLPTVLTSIVPQQRISLLLRSLLGDHGPGVSQWV